MGNQLNLRVKRPQRAIPQGEWSWPTEAAAIASMISLSGLKEKAVAIEAEIDASTLAKVKQGTARPSEDHLDRMMDATGSEAWLYYWLVKRGYDPNSLRRFENDVERENRELKERLAQAEHDNLVLVRAFRGQVA